ncbi:Arm DNA-binding domain-containing protein [Ochrobactrum chromiisoli]|uniref:Arm DNA-binding domain-containing protein n=1 Tax=Ochrobactrum chromiisoli TaxID=2993941 RepID=A0ABT3QJB7_9HYPH|nr:Arm DNA-binding domain-containing protein [Ochrobactrum chromiisoli]MCX2695690.1 Arm DNA-binding domain-containing protein [Ochrobactrum chromiisoli]
MALTDTAIKALKQGVSARKYSDANGLFLLVQPSFTALADELLDKNAG